MISSSAFNLPRTPVDLAAGLLVLCVLVASLPTAAQPGLALRDPGLAIARDSNAPINWRSRTIEESVSLAVPWFGSSDDLPADTWRTLLVVEAQSPSLTGPLLHLRYNPAESAVEMLTVFRPRVMGREPSGGNPDDSVLGAIRVEGVPLEADRHHCAVLTFDADAGEMALSVASQGSAAVRSAQLPGAVASIPPIGPQGRIVLGNPFPGGASHTDPIFPTVFKRGLIDAATLETIWQTPGGPRLIDLTGTGSQIDDDIIFFLLATGSRSYQGPADDGLVRMYFEGDSATWQAVASARPLLAFSDGVEVEGQVTDALAPVEVTPVFEPDQAWSDWWQLSTPQESLILDLPAIPGYLPRLNAVLAGGRIADTALTAWGLGNSRWSNASSVPASLTDPKPLSRSHLLGLREARPERDGGLIVLNFGATDFIDGIDLEGDVSADLFSNWTRFGYGGSFASSPGTGAPGHLAQDGSAIFLSDLVGDPGDPAPTQSLALVLERPRGGTVLLDMYVADADGTGRILTADATPLPGSVGPINTDTTRVERVITAVSSTAVDVEGDASAIEPGDALVGEDDTVVNVVESVEGQTVRLRFAWTVEPAVGITAAFGPVGYRLAGYTFDAPASESPRRGLRIQHAGGGRVTLTGVGIRSLDPNRICYVLGGRGGLGQAQQAEREAPGTLAAMSDVLGVELFFTGLATQSDDTLGALEAQLGDRLLTAEFIGTPDVINAQSNTLGSQDAAETHAEILDGARRYDAWAYFQIQDEYPGMLEQYMALLRHDPAHPNGRGMLAAAELWWSRLEATADTLLTNDGCPADVNRDRQVNPADFNAWVIAFNTGSFAADQNGDAVISPADFNGWVINYNAGCP